MAAAASQIYFRFRIWQCHSSKNIEICLHTKFRRISQYTTEILLLPVSETKHRPFWNYNSSFDFDVFIVISMSFCTITPNFVPIRPFLTKSIRHNHFQDGGRERYWICSMEIVDHPRSDVYDRSSPVEFRINRIYNFGDIAIFIFDVLVWNCLFTPILGGIWGPISQHDVTYRSNPQKSPRCVETRRLSHKAWKSIPQLDLAACPRKQELSYCRVSARSEWCWF